MLLGCLGPLLLIFVLPLVGVREGWVIPIALAAMLACHLLTATFSWRRGGSDRDATPPTESARREGGSGHAHH
ncbi:MAG: hypothetical protein ACT4PL_03905 [Phycisphaerales bacterium]|jgi:hypothetical protein